MKYLTALNLRSQGLGAPDSAAPEADTAQLLDIVYEDAYLLVINKPAGLVRTAKGKEITSNSYLNRMSRPSWPHPRSSTLLLGTVPGLSSKGCSTI